MKEECPLTKLIVTEKELDEYLLYELLKDYITIGELTGEFIFSEKYPELNSRKQIVIILLIQKARVRLGKAPKEYPDENLRPKDIVKLTGIPGGTARPVLKELKKKGLISLDEGNYFISNHSLPKIKKFLKD